MKTTIALATLALALAAGASAAAQSPYALSIEGATTQPTGAQFSLSIVLDSAGGAAIAGWSFGVCHSSEFFDIQGAEDGAATAHAKNGGPPDFASITVIPDGGFTVGVVICFTGCSPLPPGNDRELNVATYGAGNAAGSGNIGFCSTLGTPPVATVVVVGGASVTPVQVGATIQVVAPPPPGFEFIAPDVAAEFDPATGEGSFAIAVAIAEDPESAGFPNASQGFSMALAHDPGILAVMGAPGPSLPFEPDFVGPSVLAAGWSIGVVYSFLGTDVLAFPAATPVVEVAYAISGLAGSPATSTALSWSNALGSPPVANVVVVGGQSIAATFADGQVDLAPVSDLAFIRGDCNADRRVNIADGIFLLNDLFLAGPDPSCSAACDTNDSGAIDLADAVSSIQYLLLGGPPPAAPFPGCGVDPGAPCEASACP